MFHVRASREAVPRIALSVSRRQPQEWVGMQGVVVTSGVERDAWWRVRLDGDKVTTRFYGSELEPACTGVRP